MKKWGSSDWTYIQGVFPVPEEMTQGTKCLGLKTTRGATQIFPDATQQNWFIWIEFDSILHVYKTSFCDQVFCNQIIS